jgi:thiol-disulfide isomerase/thioredoxin
MNKSPLVTPHYYTHRFFGFSHTNTGRLSNRLNYQSTRRLTQRFSLLILLSLLLIMPKSWANTTIAPAWQLMTQQGQTISLAQFKGKPVILHFWATWCPYCKRLQPTLVKLAQQYHDQGVTLVGISFNEDDDAKPQDELAQRGYHFITAVNGEAVAKLYGVTGTPTTFFINADGEIIYRTSNSEPNNPVFELAIKALINK